VTITELVKFEKYDTTVRGSWTILFVSDGIFKVSSKKTFNGAYSIQEYVGDDEQEAVAAFMASEDKHQ
jgi:hypothetical protein